MNAITTLLVLLIVTSFILPASAIMYASGSTDNNDDSSGGSTDNGDDSSSSGSTDNGDNGDDSSSGGSTDNGDNGDDSSSGGSTEKIMVTTIVWWSTENNAASPSGFRESNDTGNATQESNNTGGNNTGTAQADFYNGILEVHNSERAAVGVRRSCGATRSLPTPRIGSIVSWRQADTNTVSRRQGGNKLNHARTMRVRTCK